MQDWAGWFDAEMIEANASGRPAPGQLEMLLGRRPAPPVLSLALIGVGVAVGAVLVALGQTGPAIGAVTVFLSGGLGTMGGYFDTRRRRRALHRALVDPRLGHGYGEVVTDPQGGVEVRTATFRVSLGLGVPTAPEPGEYLMYWLEQDDLRDRVLLSLRPAEGGPEAATWAAGRQLLADAMGRSEWELRYNRVGELSPPQRFALARQLRRSVLGCVATVVVTAGCFAGSLVQLSDPARRAKTDDLVGALIPAVVGVLVLAGVGVVVIGQRRQRAILRAAAPVRQATGSVSLRRVSLEGEAQPDWRLTLGELRFDLTTTAARGFFAPEAYTLYYLPDEPTLLAAEPAPALPADREVWPRHDWAELNAAGTLAAEQRDQLVGSPPRSHIWFLTGIEAVLAGGVLDATLFSTIPLDAADVTLAAGVPVILAAVWLGTYAWRAAARRRRVRLVDAARPRTSDGEIVWSAGGYRGYADGTALHLAGWGARPPAPGTYRLHWLPGPRPLVLSAAPVDRTADP